MKIQDKRPTVAKTPADPKTKPTGAKPRAFSEKLRKGQPATPAKKEEPKDTPNRVPGSLSERLVNPQQQQPQQQENGKPEQVSRIAAPTLPVSLQGLVSEIQMHVERGGPIEVEIQFNSQVFDGLRVNITQEAGAVAIKFTANNDMTAQLLAQHVPALSRALATKGIAVSGISTSTGSGSGSGSDSGSDSGGKFGNARGRQRRGR